MAMDIDQFARAALAEALPQAPAEVRANLQEDADAGEFLTCLIELIEQAPGAVTADQVNGLATVLDQLPPGAHRTIAERAIQTFREQHAA